MRQLDPYFAIFCMNGNSSMVNSAQHLHIKKALQPLLVLCRTSVKGTQ